MSNCNRDLCKRHMAVVMNTIKRMANEKNNKKYIVLDIQLPATIDAQDYNAATHELFNFTFPRAVAEGNNAIDVTTLDAVKVNNTTIGTDGVYVTPTLRYTNIDENDINKSTMNEYVVLDNNGGNPKQPVGTIPSNPVGTNMIYLKRTVGKNGDDITSTIEPTEQTLTTNLRGLMFRIKIPWSMSVFCEDMSDKIQKEYGKFVDLMDNLTRFTDMRLDYLDENYENPKFEAIIPFKNYATSNNGKAIALTMAGSVSVGGLSTIGDTYWRFYPGGLVLINQGKPDVWANKKIRLTFEYDD